MQSPDKDTFCKAVYDIVAQIPFGRACCYGAIAKAIGYSNHSRMVGQAMKACEKHLPAHRVVNSQGMLSGKDCFKNPQQMQQSLESEGVKIINNKIKNWKKVSWNPLEEISFLE